MNNKMSFSECSNKSCEEIVKELSSSDRLGLTAYQYSINREKYGLNVLLKKEKTWVDFIIQQYKSPLILLLLGAVVVSFALGEYINAITIFFIVTINAFIGFYQEFKATKSVKLLEQFLEYKSKVIRDGKETLIDSKELVPGDLVIVELGDHIPADIRFVEVNGLGVDESLLSGESLPVQKTHKTLKTKTETVFRAKNIGFSGTTVVEGSGKGIVFSTGQETLFGKIGDLTIGTIQETKFFQNLKKVSYFLIRMVAITLTLLVVAHIIFQSTNSSVVEILMFSVALAVGITPEALPAISTLALSRGALLLAKNKVIVKRLSAIEDLGGIEVICTDKTGTLTENILTVHDIKPFSHMNPLFYMGLAGTRPLEREIVPENPLDKAVWSKLSDSDFSLLSGYKRLGEIPFDAKHRRTLVLVEDKSGATLVVRGAYEEITKRSNLSEKEKNELSLWIKENAQIGCRVMALAKKKIELEANNIWDHEKEMDFIGLVSFLDPIKSSVRPTLDKARGLGLEIKILSGDGAEIVGHVATQVGLITSMHDVVSGEVFATLDDKEKEKVANETHVFARILPEQKSEIIKILKKRRSVAFLGDGINDAPALKEADVGLAVNVSADIAKDAADIVLLKKSLRTIVDGIVIGRQIFVNTFKYLKTTLASNLGNFYSIAVVSLFVPFLPLLPLQILLVNLLSDAPMMAISTDYVNPSELERPTNYNLRRLVFFTVTFGLVSSIFDFIFFYKFYKGGVAFFQTHWFIFSILTEILFIFSGRSKLIFFREKRPSFWLLFFAGLSLCLAVLIPFSSIGKSLFSFENPTYRGLLFMAGMGAAYFITCEIFKIIYYFFMHHHSEVPPRAVK